MAFGFNGASQPQKGTKEYHERCYNVARNNLLAIMILTVVSVFAIIWFDSEFYFSHYFTIVMAYVGYLFLSGEYAEIVDAEEMIEGIAVDQSMFAVIGAVYVAIAAGALLILGLCWVLSKKHYAFMIAAAVVIGLDTLYILGDFDVIGIIFHAWMLYYMIMGSRSGIALKRISNQEAVDNGDYGQPPYGGQNPYDGQNPYGNPTSYSNPDDNAWSENGNNGDGSVNPPDNDFEKRD